MSLANMLCFANDEEDEDKPKISLSNSCRFIPSLIREACAHCHVSSCLKSPSSLSFDDEEETLLYLLLIHLLFFIILFLSTQAIILEVRNRAMKAKTKPKGYLFGDNLHWVLSPTTGKLLIAPKEEKIDIGKEDEGDGDVQSEVFYSVKSCFSRCSSKKELEYFSHCRDQSIWEEFTHCEGWPFGLCKKPLMLSPLPSSSSDSWTWREKNVSMKISAST